MIVRTQAREQALLDTAGSGNVLAPLETKRSVGCRLDFFRID